jgi:hypothetical protein
MSGIDAMTIDQVARAMASKAGVVWDSLNDYPGYTKNYWREQAQGILHVADRPGRSRQAFAH